MDDLIRRQDAVSRFSDLLMVELEGKRLPTWEEVYNAMQGLPSAQPEIIRCKDCKYRMPYEWMFSETWRSISIDDYSEDEIGCKYCEMTMKADDFCSKGERRTDEQT